MAPAAVWRTGGDAAGALHFRARHRRHYLGERLARVASYLSSCYLMLAVPTNRLRRVCPVRGVDLDAAGGRRLLSSRCSGDR